MKQFIKAIIFLILTGIAFSPLIAQEMDAGGAEVEYSTDGKGWVFGLNVGAYYPSKFTAAFYNGSPANVNNVNYVMSNYYWYQEIFFALGANDSVAVAGLPQNMHYQLAIRPGLYFQYCFNERMSLLIEFNYMRLKANDVISFEVDPKLNNTFKEIRLYPIRGVEERVYADIGIKRTFPQTDKLSYFATGGLSVNSTKVIKHSIYIEEKEYSLINTYGNSNYIPNSNMQTYNVYQGGIGFGMYAGAGAALTFGGGIVMEIGLTAHWLMVKLDHYESMNPGIGAYARFLF